MEVSYAVIYMDVKRRIFLIVHPTHELYWSLPKGGMDPVDEGCGARAAARELYEETGISVGHDMLKPAGRHEYYRIGRNGKAKDKDLEIYLYETDKAAEISEMACTSMVKHAPGAPFPENDGFKYIGYEEIDSYFGPDGARALRDALNRLGIQA